jgi:hypothetical protein
MFFTLLSIVLAQGAMAAQKPHTVSFGKWTTVKWFADQEETTPLDLKVRPLFVDGKLKEYTLGMPHEVTERLLVVRRAFQLNDSLPDDKAPRWRWERGGWLLVDRAAGRVTQVLLPEFDTYYSVVSWYRDYAAYCGLSEDGEKSFLVVMQLGRRRPVLRRATAITVAEGEPDSACPSPDWQRQPVRVTFTTRQEKSTYQVRGHAVDLLREPDNDDAGAN